MKTEKKHHYWLYVLICEQDKKYVGITTKTPELRMRQHQNEFLGASWTKKYKPTALFDQKDLGEMSLDQAEKYENKIVRVYINKYGYNNVRGGDLTFSGEYVKRFGYYLSKDDWEEVAVISLLILVIIFEAIMYCMKK